MTDERNGTMIPSDLRRVPPGQRVTENWPVLTYGSTPAIELAAWKLTVQGLVEEELVLSWDEFMALPQTTVTSDIHCVTRWSKLDNEWRGVKVSDLLVRARPLSSAAQAIVTSYGGYTANVPLADFAGNDVLLAHAHNGKPLPTEHGGPLRLVVPHLYFWKSAKWVRSFTLIGEEKPGFWEMYGYHMRGDPWKEERYSD